MLDSHHAELKDFLEKLDCVIRFQKLKEGGPVQEVPENSSAFSIGCRVLLPLPLGQSNLAQQIMEEIDSWAKDKNLKRFGFVEYRDCPLLMIGLRKL